MYTSNNQIISNNFRDAENRTKLDVSDNLINNTNNPLYGGTNHPEELKYLIIVVIFMFSSMMEM